MEIEEAYNKLIGAIEEMICTSTAVMAPYPVDVVGRPAPFGKKGKKAKRSRGDYTVYEDYDTDNDLQTSTFVRSNTLTKNGKRKGR